MKGKRAKACDISSRVRKEVLERDANQCIICGTTKCLQIAHYISRGRLGLGTAKNLGAMCIRCHTEYDNGHNHKEIKVLFENHLKSHYKGWNEKDLIYKKYNT